MRVLRAVRVAAHFASGLATQRFVFPRADAARRRDLTRAWCRRLLELMHVQQPDKLLPKVEEPVTSDPLTENMSAMEGKPIKAEQSQDHWTHIQGHLIHANAPWVAGNPLVNPQSVNLILAHINEHIQMMFARSIADTAQQILAQQPGAPEEQVAVSAMQQRGRNSAG